MLTAITQNKKTTGAALIGIALVVLNAAQQALSASGSMPVLQAITSLDWQSILSSLAALIGVLFAKDGDANPAPAPPPAAPTASAQDASTASPPAAGSP